MLDGMTDVIWKDATAQAAAIRSGETSAVELVEEHLARIARFDPELAAYVAVDAEGARSAARAADAAVAGGDPDPSRPFLGVTISIKDVIDVAGLATTHSCKALVDAVAVADDPLVRRLRDAGFVVLGKTNVPEFCTTMTSSELHGICRNPWDPERTPGGSSGGAATAVAAGLCAVAHGTDGAGSVRVPAAFCGLVGIKPTRGLVSFGTEAGNPYFGTSVDGVLSRTVRDAAALVDVFAGRRDPVLADACTDGVAPAPLRIALTTTAPFGVVDEECARVARETADVLAALGHHVEERTPRWDVILAPAAGPMSVPGPAGLIPLEQVGQLEPRNRPLLERLTALTLVEHSRWVDQCRTAAVEFSAFWDDVDLLVSPTAGMVAPSVDWAPWDQSAAEHMATFSGFPNFAQPFNLSGQPAISLPVGWSRDGLPIGVQLAGRSFEEAGLVRVARQLELALPWSDRRPPMFG
ncbi:MAG: amidase [Actinobacteria bacterium]|nr:amidase [Actinomycetota bacterium]